ncbi:hypothetical protein CI238_10730 [Colletotrichum incanum]|uniref:NmrA-like family protein n=1 Tax=Colletotrichum incanum TaxID=1573173 RepID=A0A167CMT3_COLIC|nr:hypothetical protein CI238_10730 [Colletotrichum incanum]
MRVSHLAFYFVGVVVGRLERKTPRCPPGVGPILQRNTAKLRERRQIFQDKAFADRREPDYDVIRGLTLRPCSYDYLAENSGDNYPELIKTGTLRHTFNDGAGIPHTVADDIGKYAAAALQKPAKFGGEEIELGNEYLHPDATAKILSMISGCGVKAEKRGQAKAAEIGQWLFGQRFFDWANVKVLELKAVADGAKDIQVRYGIPFASLESALSKEREAVLAGLPA